MKNSFSTNKLNCLNRRTFLLSSSLFALNQSISAQDLDKSPNIIVITADSIGYGDLGCYDGKFSSPYIDSIAKSGVTLTNCYTTSTDPVSSQSTWITGRYPQRLQDFRIQNQSKRDQNHSLAKMLARFDYKTAFFGEWRLNDRFGWQPNSLGYDGNTDTSTTQICKQTCEYIQQNQSEKFFIFVSLPNDPEKDRLNSISDIDTGVGSIYQTLQSLKIDQNTLLIFCSIRGSHNAADNSPLQGTTQTLYEGGIRVPCILRWPNLLPPNRISHQTTITMDLFATVLNIANAKPTRHIDGISLLKYFMSLKPDVEQTFIWHQSESLSKAVRWGNWKWLKIQEKEYLFNLQEDISETENRFHRNIDIVHWLRDIYNQWDEAVPGNNRG
jgi:arylsulfatase A